MSEDRWRELGIPRRNFLKRTAAAAFVAPVVVSFSFDGVAEASGRSRVQCFSNQQQYGNQLQTYFDAQFFLQDMFNAVATAVAEGGLSFIRAEILEQSVVLITLQIASGQDSHACQSLYDFGKLVQAQSSHYPPGLAAQLQTDISSLEGELGCVCTVN